MRLRLLKTLSGPGKRFLNDTKQLKYILCPVVAKSPAEQRKFYELFDRFHKDVLSEEAAIVIPKKLPFWEKIPKWLMWVLITSPVAILIIFGLLIIWPGGPVPEQGIAPLTFPASVGDTVVFRNLAPQQDTLDKNMHWSLVDDESGAIELEEHQSHHWQLVVPDPGPNPRKTVQLVYEDKKTGQRDTFTNSFIVQCLDGIPRIETKNIPQNGNPGTELDFSITLPGQDSLTISWDFGDGSETIQGPTAKHTYDSIGNYQVRVSIINENAPGFCEANRSFPISIGQEKVFLFFKTLKMDTMEPMASFGWATWILMSLLALAIVYYWVRWFARKAPEPEQDEKEKDPIPDHFKSSDKAPYLIPYRSQNDFIQVDPQLFRFADTMRSRQEGLRRSLDVPGSVKATIEGGGFPKLLEKRDTQPTEYLFLIDEQSMHSHQAKLFDYLINFLKEKDVLLETFYYNTDFNRFWNKYYPKGIRDVMLPRLYQHHRLVVLGDAHGLLDPFGHNAGELRQSSSKLLKAWKERLLITPLPPTSWTWKEKALHALFPVFPADVLGLGQAMSYIEKGQAEDEYQPDFETWREGLLADRDESDINRRRWHRLKEYKVFLKDHPDVYKWLCALSVCPQVNWETTIAIGQALKPVGVEVTFDKLLLLARIPFLQTGILSGRLRLEMMQEMDGKTEKLARDAIRRELEAIRAKVKDGHANFELNSQLAVQRFALDPGNKGHQSDIRFLLNNGLLDKRQVSELEKAISKQAQPQQQQVLEKSLFTKSIPIPPSLDEYLAEQEELPELPKKPFVTPDFIKALSATVLFIVLSITIWSLDGSDRLYQLAFGPEKTAKEVGDESQLQNLYYFVKETFPIDSAKILNNSSVSIYNNLITREVTKESRGDTSFLDDMLPTADRGFQRALSYNPDYALARANRGKMWYSVGSVLYNSKLEDYSFAPEDFERLRGYFDRALREDATRLDALHAKGLLHYYEGTADSAFVNYNQLLSESDSLYFDTLSQYPHLRYLLYKDSIATEPIQPARQQQGAQSTEPLDVTLYVFNKTTNEPIVGVSILIVEELPSGEEEVVAQIINEIGNEFEFAPESGRRYRIVASKQGFKEDQKSYEFSRALLTRQDQGLFSFFLEQVTLGPVYYPPASLYFDHEKPLDIGDGQEYGYFVDVLNEYYGRRDEFKKISAAGLSEEDKFLVEGRLDQFFELEVRESINDWQYTLDGLVDYLLQEQRWQLILEGFDDPLGTIRESELIAQRRIDFINNMVLAYNNGIFVPYINSGQLVIVEINNGEKFADKNISDNPRDERNSIYNIAPTLERRVEVRLEPQSETEEQLTPLQREVRAIIVDKLGVDENEVTKSAKLAYDLGADDLDKVEIILEIEKKYDIIITDNVAETIESVNDFYAIVGLTIDGLRGDDDQDGVPNNQDNCPNTGPGETVDENGCSADDYFNLEDKGEDIRSIVEQNEPVFREPEMVFVQGGTFQMGCVDDKANGIICRDDEKPAHEVQLNTYLIGKYEVTQQEWASVMENNPSTFSGCPNCPVERVSWDEVQEFIRKLNEKTGKNYRLPTEAEWEYAARGGNRGGNEYIYSGSNNLADVGWFYGGSSGRNTSPVGGKNPNALGVYDMSGNVREWCSDFYGADYYKNSQRRNPTGPARGNDRVHRGGSIYDGPEGCSVFVRSRNDQSSTISAMGFRLARTYIIE